MDHSSLELPGSISPSNAPASDLFGKLKSSPTAKPSLPIISRRRSGTRTFESLGNTSLKPQRSSPQGFLASPQVLPGSEEARAILAGSGQKLLRLYDFSSRHGRSLKMFAAFCLLSKRPYSSRCVLTWKPRVTRFKRLLFQLAPSMPRTGERGSGLWATPRAGQSAGSKNVKMEWGKKPRVNGRPITTSLTDQVKMWPTPKGVPSGPDFARASREGSGGDDLATAVARKGGGSLNPTWVEWLMGYPLGWTALKPSETPSSLKSRNGSPGIFVR